MRAFSAALLAVVAGCSFLRDPLPVDAMGEQPSVHALLLTGSDTVKLLLQQVGPSHSPHGDPVTARPIPGADVRLLVAGQTVRLLEAPADFSCTRRTSTVPPPEAGLGCYGAVLPDGVRPGARYSLRISLPGGGTIEGETTTLPALQLDSPSAGARIGVRVRESVGSREDRTALRLRLRGAEGSASAAVDILPHTVYSGGAARAEYTCYLALFRTELFPRNADGTVEAPLYGIRCVRTESQLHDPQFRADSVRATLRVVAYDSASTRYIQAQARGSDAVAARDVTQGVTGAIGLFAAAARGDQEVVLIPCSTKESCPDK